MHGYSDTMEDRIALGTLYWSVWLDVFAWTRVVPNAVRCTKADQKRTQGHHFHEIGPRIVVRNGGVAGAEQGSAPGEIHWIQ